MPDDATIEEALRAAFQSQVALLFKNLCDGHEDPDAGKRFDRGMVIAMTNYDAQLKQLRSTVR